MKYIHTQGRNGCNYGIIGQYDMGEFPAELSHQQTMLSGLAIMSVSWNTIDGNDVLQDEIKRANTTVWVEESTECTPETMEKLAARARTTRRRKSASASSTETCMAAPRTTAC